MGRLSLLEGFDVEEDSLVTGMDYARFIFEGGANDHVEEEVDFATSDDEEPTCAPGFIVYQTQCMDDGEISAGETIHSTTPEPVVSPLPLLRVLWLGVGY
jgi:hypothetical protein